MSVYRPEIEKEFCLPQLAENRLENVKDSKTLQKILQQESMNKIKFDSKVQNRFDKNFKAVMASPAERSF